MGSNCEHCHSTLTSMYGSGRFCSVVCARAFSTASKRTEINAKLSATNKGRKFKHKRKRALSDAHKESIRAGIAARSAAQPFEKWGWPRKRSYIIEDQGGICNKCHKVSASDWNGKPLSFQLDHIDGDRRNNARENLEALCPNCHTQTPTWGVRNMRITPEEWGKRISNGLQNLRASNAD